MGVFVNRDFKSISNTLILIEEETDDFLLRYARRIMRSNPDVKIEVLDLEILYGKSERITAGIDMLTEQFGAQFKLSQSHECTKSYLEKFNFMMVSYQSWDFLVSQEISTLKHIPSTLIINKKPSRFGKSNDV